MKLENYSNNTHEQENILLPDWLEEELVAWKPPKKINASEWADENRILDSKTSPIPGKWKTSRTPYLKKIMNQINVKGVQVIVFCKPTQIGGTECLNIIFGYIVDQNPDPTLIIYPTEKLAESISVNRIQPMIKLSPALNKRFKENDSKRLELQFDTMTAALIGSNSEADLSSRPIRYLLFDEIDKFKKWTGEEASPISLALERAKNFLNRKIFMASTPTLVTGNIWKNLMTCDVIYQYYVPCPHCGEFQTFKFSQVKWPNEYNDIDDIEKRAQQIKRRSWYECEHCGDNIEDKHKNFMLKKGEWKPVKYTEEGSWEAVKKPDFVEKVGFHINSIYSPWVTFGEVAEKFIKSKDLPEELQNFVNSWLGEPWKDESFYTKSNAVLKKQSLHERGTVPEEAEMLTAGVDVQKGHFWYTIRAWGERITSWLVDYGRAETWDEIEEIIVNRKYLCKETGELKYIKLALIDSGYMPDDVYMFCSYFPEVCKPSKGSSQKMRAPYSVSKIEKNEFGGLNLWVVDTHYYKEFIFGRLKKELGSPGSFMVFQDCPMEYADQLTSEQKVLVQNKNGTVKEEYQKISSHAANHILDCEVYAACAAEVAGVRYLRKPEKKLRKPEKKKNTGNWIPNTKNWF